MEKGDIVHIEYEMWVKGAKNELYETNIEKVARDAGKWADGTKYNLMPVLIGHSRYMKGLEDAILKAEPGKEYSIEILPADGHGDRDPEKVKVFSMNSILRLPEFQRKDAKYPEVGMDINIDGKVGTIAGIYAGRARVDFNHKLAGKNISYKFKIVKKDETLQDKVKSVIEMDYGQSADFGVESGKDDVSVTLPDICKYDPSWFKAKYLLVADMRDVLGIKLIRFIEEYRKKEEKKEEVKTETKHDSKDKADHEKHADDKKHKKKTEEEE